MYILAVRIFVFKDTMVMEEQESADTELASERIPVPRVQQPKRLCSVVKRNKSVVLRGGKPRLRKKALHTAILKQMEFYFSDANLSKDRYLSELIKQNPCNYAARVFLSVYQSLIVRNRFLFSSRFRCKSRSLQKFP